MHELLKVFHVRNELVQVCFILDCFVFTPPQAVLNRVQLELHNSHVVSGSRCCLMDSNTLVYQVRTECNTRSALK